jgi:hypothetical protein
MEYNKDHFLYKNLIEPLSKPRTPQVNSEGNVIYGGTMDEAPYASKQLQHVVNNYIVPPVNAMGYPLSPMTDQMRDSAEEFAGLGASAKGVGNFVKKPSQYGRGVKSVGETYEAAEQSGNLMASMEGKDMNDMLDSISRRPPSIAEPVGLQPSRGPYQPSADESVALRGLLDRPSANNPNIERARRNLGY